MGSRSHIVRYYLYQTSLAMGFYVPINVVYLLDKDFSLAFVGLTTATFSATLLVAELPTGYVGDRLGRRFSLVLGTVFRVVGLAGYIVAETAVTFLALKVCFGLGWAFRSGATDAYLYEYLRRHLYADRFSTIRGRGEALLLATSAGTAVLGGWLYSIDPQYPFIANTILAATGLPILLTLPTVNVDTDQPYSVTTALGTLRDQLSRPAIKWVVVYTILVLLVFDVTRSYEQPALQAIGISATGLGSLYAALKLAAAAASSLSGRLRTWFGTKAVLAAMAPFVLVLYGTALVIPVVLVPIAFSYRMTRSVLHPVRNHYLNDRLADTGRATVLSGASMILSAAGVLARLGTVPVVNTVGARTVIAGTGILLGMAATVVWTVTTPVRTDATTATQSRAAVPTD